MKAALLWMIIGALPIIITGNESGIGNIDLSLLQEHISEENLENYLEDFINNPLDWNRTQPADIESLPLNDELIDRLLALKKRHLEFDDWQQFQAAAQLDQLSLEMVKLFFKIMGDRFERDVHLKNYVSINQKENVDLNRSQLCGRFALNRQIEVGFIAERDQGEKQLFDYRNISLITQPFADAYTVGLAAYTFDWGHGLLFSRSNLAFKGTSVGGTVLAGTPRFSAYTGSDENRYLQGAYLHRQGRRLTLFSFVSRQRLDATIEDSLVQSFRETGIHRTDSELAAKNALLEHTVSGGMVFTKEQNRLGLLVFQTGYPLPVRVYQSRRRQRGISLYQKFQRNDWRFSGELALLSPENFAVVQGFVCRTENISLGAQYRYFSDRFATRLSTVMKEYTSAGGNEQGLYLGAECRIKRGFKTGGYIDFFSQHRSFKKGLAPDRGTEAVAFLDRNWSGQHSLRLRLKRKVTETATAKYQISVIGQSYLRRDAYLTFRGVLNEIDRKQSFAASVSGTLKEWKGVALTLGTTHFYSPVFDTRIYLYEAGIPLRFNMVTLSGSGRRYFGVLQSRFKNGITAATALKTQRRRLISETRTDNTFLLEFQMVVDL